MQTIFMPLDLVAETAYIVINSLSVKHIGYAQQRLWRAGAAGHGGGGPRLEGGASARTMTTA